MRVEAIDEDPLSDRRASGSSTHSGSGRASPGTAWISRASPIAIATVTTSSIPLATKPLGFFLLVEAIGNRFPDCPWCARPRQPTPGRRHREPRRRARSRQLPQAPPEPPRRQSRWPRRQLQRPRRGGLRSLDLSGLNLGNGLRLSLGSLNELVLRNLGLGKGRAVEQLALDDLLRAGVAALADAGALADTVAQVVQLGAADVTASGDLDLLDLRRMQRERALDAYSKGVLADGEGLARPVALALDHDTLEDLGAAASALDHLEVDTQAVASVELRNSAELCALQAFDDGAHCSCSCCRQHRLSWIKTDRKRCAAEERAAAYGSEVRAEDSSGVPACDSPRSRDCSSRQLLMFAWCPESRTSGTDQPR